MDFIFAYTQAEPETIMYMEIPHGFEFNNSRHWLKLKKNLYGGKAAGRIWNQHLHKGLTQLGFKQSSIDECVYYQNKTIFLCYIDDTILIDPDDEQIDKVIQELKGLQYDVTDEGSIEDYLGVQIQQLPSGQIKITQPQLINSILKDLKLEQTNGKRYPAKTQPVPASTTVTLPRDVDGTPHKETWSY
jgi:Reverse transcriptase (RNA-dependent DNA polymerase)